MEFFSTIGKFHESTENYTLEDLASAIQEKSFREVYSAVLPGIWESAIRTDEIKRRITGSGMGFHDLLSESEMEDYGNAKAALFEAENRDPDLKVKVKLLEIVDATIYSYMKGFWKDSQSVNSELTDGVFRAKHLLMSAVVTPFEISVWKEWHSRLKDRILSLDDKKIAVIVNVESRYWFVDNLSS